MNWQSISPILRVGLLLGAVCYLALILWLLKKKKLTVRYSIIWLISAGVLLVFAVFPYVVLVLTDLLGMAVPVNVVFLLVIAFILLLLLSLSSIVSGFAERSSALRRKTPSWKSACADWKRSSRRRISKRKTKKPRNAPSKGGDSLSKNAALFRQAAYDQGLWPRSPRTAAFGGRFALHMPRHWPCGGVCALRAALSARLPAREASHRSDTRLRAQSPPFLAAFAAWPALCRAKMHDFATASFFPRTLLLLLCLFQQSGAAHGRRSSPEGVLRMSSFFAVAFLVFLAGTCLAYFVLPKAVRPYWLLVCSYLFYMYDPENAGFVALLLSASAVTWAAALLLERLRVKWMRRVCLVVSLALCVGCLFYYKYFNFLGETLAALLDSFGLHYTAPSLDILAPVGISYFTFAALGYVIDVYRGRQRAEKNFFFYALFVSFFPLYRHRPHRARGAYDPPIQNAADLRLRPRFRRAVPHSVGLFQKIRHCQHAGNSGGCGVRQPGLRRIHRPHPAAGQLAVYLSALL